MDEEFLELEARLYAQIHHEAPHCVEEDAGPSTESQSQPQQQEPVPGAVERTVTATSVINKQAGASRVPASRYWAGGQNQVAKTSTVNNSSLTAPVVEQSKAPTATTKTNVVAAKKVPTVESVAVDTSDKTAIIAQPAAAVVASTSGKQKPAAVQRGGSVQTPKQSPKTTNAKTNFQRAAQNWQKTNDQVPTPNLLKEDLRFNPAASWLKPKTKAEKKPRKDQQAPPNVITKGPFVKQVQKLQKAIRIEGKKQKSKQAKNASAKRNPKAVEVIILPSSDEDDGDVILIPVAPPPTVTIDDSDEERKEDVLKIDENARDGTDVDLDNSHFAVPQLTITDAALEKRTRPENSSRCTSPCSVLSSDDFIGQNDRSRLLDGKGMADDEDLQLLTADVDSLMEAPKTPHAEETLSSHVEEIMAEEQQDVVEESSNDVQCTADFLAPSTSKKSYRVDQTQFRAVDVYESESDITDSVYSKGAPKETVIRAIGSSSDNDDVQELLVVPKTKRLRKRRASSSNKESDANNDESTNSEEEEEDSAGVETTGVSFISRGPAVERIKTKKRKDSLSSSRRASAGGGGSVGHMSDNEFLATLNSLAQGNDNSPELEPEHEQEDESDTENAPSARDIAEKVLERNRRNAVIIESDEDSVSIVPVPVVQLPESFSAAVPSDTLTALNTVFATIDQLATRKERPDPNEAIVIANTSDHSDVDVEVIEELPTTSAAQRKMNRETGDPVYHVVYSRGSRFPGGIGWNDEMRRFYNNSWKGETLQLRDVWQQMNNDKKLWKIYTEDRFPKDRRFSNRNLKCYNCCEFGHTRAKCTRRKKAPVCYMCGEYGHFEPRCPNTICLRCGNKTHVFTKSCNACTFQNRLICPVCKVRGHDLKSCPDKWRRYHSTTEPNTYPSSTIEYKNRKFCCICAGRGHLSETCKSAVRFMEYPTIVSEVKSHQKSYNDQAIKMHQSNLCFNLLYTPCENFSFELAENTTPKKYYGRFLNAVGMGYMLKRKRKLSALTATPKRSKNLAKNYVPNPYSKKAAEEVCTVPDDDAPDQVQEITESGNLDDDVQIEGDVEVVAVGSIDSSSIEEFTIVDEVNVEDEEESVELTITESSHEDSNNFKTPTDVPILSQSPQQCEHLAIDSDSNYSFSEHFEMPAATAPNAATPQTAEAAIPEPIVAPLIEPTTTAADATAMETTTNAKPRAMELPLPDFIPLTSSSVDDDEEENIDEDVVQETGISRRFVSAPSDEGDSDSGSKSPLPDLPCDAKIFLTHFHSSYLLSPKGHAFLVEKSKACDIKSRLDWTSVGHVLVIYGLPLNQNNFHRELLLHYRQLSDQMKLKRSENHQKVPKRTDVLIRFLRDDINQLLNNLGNPNELLKRLKMLDKQHSKNCFKAAEKVRRSINMILIGQAGLMDGNMHLDKLLLCLKTLINDYNSSDVTPNELRNEIDEHWKVIFTPYRHDNYLELVQTYNKLISKNRLPKLNIDPLLLGQKVLDTSLSAEQKEQLDKRPAKAKVAAKIVPNPLNPKNSKLLNKQNRPEMAPPAPSMKIKPPATVSSPSKAPPAPSMHIKGKLAAAHTPTKALTPSATPIKTKATPTPPSKKPSAAGQSPIAATKKPSPATAGNLQQPPFANPQQKSKVATKIKEVAQKWVSTCDNLLTEIDGSAEAVKKGLVRDSKAPSMFWSRESMRYLDECIKLAESNNVLLEKLQRVQKKSQSGALSYNDYRAVIKLHSAMLG